MVPPKNHQNLRQLSVKLLWVKFGSVGWKYHKQAARRSWDKDDKTTIRDFVTNNAFIYKRIPFKMSLSVSLLLYQRSFDRSITRQSCDLLQLIIVFRVYFVLQITFNRNCSYKQKLTEIWFLEKKIKCVDPCKFV